MVDPKEMNSSRDASTEMFLFGPAWFHVHGTNVPLPKHGLYRPIVFLTGYSILLPARQLEFYATFVCRVTATFYVLIICF